MNWNLIKQGKIQLEPADIVLVRSPGFFGKAIRWFSRHKGESKTVVNHTLLVERGGYFAGRYAYTIIDTLWTVYRRSLYCYDNSSYEIMIVRDKSLTEKERLTITSKARSYLGAVYSPFKIALHVVDKLLGKIMGKEVVLFSQFGFGGLVICNQVVAMSYSAAGKHFDRPPQSADPDHLYDYVLSHPEKYEIVFISNGITMKANEVVNGRLIVDFA